MKITEEMLNKLNEELLTKGCIFKYVFVTGYEKTTNPIIERVPIYETYIANSIINCTKEFYDYLENFFKKYNIELSYNNTGNRCWSESGWEE